MSNPAEYEQTCEAFEALINEALSTFCARHRKYGPANIAAGGLPFLAARRNDKEARIKHGNGDFNDESLKDAYIDVANYWLIEYLWVSGQWPRPTDDARADAIREQLQALTEELAKLECVS